MCCGGVDDSFIMSRMLDYMKSSILSFRKQIPDCAQCKMTMRPGEVHSISM